MEQEENIEENHTEMADISDIEEPARVEELRKMITSAKGLRMAADFVERCLGEGNHELMHTANHYADGRVVAGFIIPER